MLTWSRSPCSLSVVAVARVGRGGARVRHDWQFGKILVIVCLYGFTMVILLMKRWETFCLCSERGVFLVQSCFTESITFWMTTVMVYIWSQRYTFFLSLKVMCPWNVCESFHLRSYAKFPSGFHVALCHVHILTHSFDTYSHIQHLLCLLCVGRNSHMWFSGRVNIGLVFQFVHVYASLFIRSHSWAWSGLEDDDWLLMIWLMSVANKREVWYRLYRSMIHYHPPCILINKYLVCHSGRPPKKREDNAASDAVRSFVLHHIRVNISLGQMTFLSNMLGKGAGWLS